MIPWSMAFFNEKVPAATSRTDVKPCMRYVRVVLVAAYAMYRVSLVSSLNGTCPMRCSCVAMKPGVMVRPFASMTY
jgi:hypothetical protein